jgi:hypothetical protein
MEKALDNEEKPWTRRVLNSIDFSNCYRDHKNKKVSFNHHLARRRSAMQKIRSINPFILETIFTCMENLQFLFCVFRSLSQCIPTIRAHIDCPAHDPRPQSTCTKGIESPLIPVTGPSAKISILSAHNRRTRRHRPELAPAGVCMRILP